MRTKVLGLIAVMGFGISALGESGQSEEAIQPTLRVDLNKVNNWRGQWVFHRSAEGELVLLGQAGPEAMTVASSDEGRTWHDWPAIRTWPKGRIQGVARKGKKLLALVQDRNGEPEGPEHPWRAMEHRCRVWRSQDEGKTWAGGEQLLGWPLYVGKPGASVGALL